jgi:TfoX N-terminal domain
MAYDPYFGDRIRKIMQSKGVSFFEKEMMGGLIFMVNEKMCCGIHIDKKYGDSLLMLKIGEKAYQQEIEKKVCLPMDFTGRPMKGFIFIIPDGWDRDSDLEYWIQKAFDFNIGTS